jgi:methionine-rich copper-binding protein CopC
MRHLARTGVGLAVLLLTATQVSAHHAELLRSEPAVGAHVATSPAVVRAWFNQVVVVPGSVLAVADGEGRRFDVGGSQRDAVDGRLLVVRVGDLPPGQYTVTWRVVAEADLDLAQGSFAFSVGGDDLAGRARREGALALGLGLLVFLVLRLGAPARS